MSKAIKRRDVIKSALGASAVAATASSAIAAPNIITDKKYQWRMAMTWPKVLPGLGTGAVRLGERITQLSGGRLEVKIYGAGELVPALGVFDAVSDGSIECAHGGSYYWLSKNRSFAFFCAVPGGLTGAEQNAWVYFDEGLKLWHELSAQFNIVPFPAGNTGVQMGGWFKKPINSLDDIKGLKMRIPGLGGEVFAKLGGNPQNIPGGELFTALQSGVIDGLEWVGPWNDMALGFHRIADYYYGPAFQEGGPMLEFLINKDAWDELPKDLQMLVKGACATENMLMFAEYQANNARAFAELRNIKSLNILPYPDDVLKAYFVEAEATLAETASLGDINKRIYESYAKFRKISMDMGSVMEYPFLKGRYLGAKLSDA
ncbi:MAG: TRAP transporter substrate-binding protein DctP [Rickettsiales bacterium]|nr:TRAP transporter substrate-binding protein DctP [Rickettsiales bacterium]